MVTLVMVLAIAINPNQLWYSAAQFALVGLYTNSLMTMLNTRQPSYITEASPIKHSMNQKSHFGTPGNGKNNTMNVVGNKPANVEFIALDEIGSYNGGDKSNGVKSLV
ncbi:hypothetical protein SERLA73DRAFT_69850 [Serpula lacrymans var. lacrymans S7.3]|uniref:Uncharacterized protein n=2 Tax=Serpula lacrymans var. lacrymans TaxID=341189 RepID=F8PIW0_SERL3|nr:uncharacterized protein SERLADRAFT_433917 [Serpula lacrymans var. lacrymans S7.9]EGO04060.1 hypothetical protein SERLA73DRAFT_69850 [Serpula lacrymans var. lacrymans S7.3]EGO29977.1 hypothetical protein SERLADRAFT_433917 [Serpula lacrymans var. lacrymans S7.9]